VAQQAFAEAFRVTPPAEHAWLQRYLPATPPQPTAPVPLVPAAPGAVPLAPVAVVVATATPAARRPAPAPVVPAAQVVPAAVRRPRERARVTRGLVDKSNEARIGLYFTVNDAPAEVLKVMAATAEQQLAELALSSRRTGAVYALLVLGFLGFLADLVAGYQSFVFGYAGLVTWLAALVLNRSIARRRPAASASKPRWGCLVPLLLLALVAVGFLVVSAFDGDEVVEVAAAAVITLMLAGLVRERTSRAKVPNASPFDDRFDDARQIFSVLKDDLPRGHPLLGWLDLTGLAPTKEVRESVSDGGAPITFYRDEWLRLKLKLVDGNVLRVSAIESVRKKAGIMKRGRRRSKWKPGATSARHQVRVSIVVNSATHVIRRPVAQQRLERLWIDTELLTDDRLVVTALASDRPSAQSLLGVLKLAYEHVSPRAP
jgi:hypothetical protein